MRIAIDARFASGVVAGVGRYSINLVRALSRILDKNELILFVNKQKKEFEASGVEQIQTAITHEMHPRGELWENVVLPLHLLKGRIDVFHSAAFFLPIFTPFVKRIATIHDLAVFRFPEAFPRRFAMYLQFIIRSSVKRADKIITASNSVKNELIELLHIQEGKISVIYEGIDDKFICGKKAEKSTIDAFKKSRELLNGFILFVGTLEPRKNIPNLLKAFSLLKERDLPVKIVIVGKKGWLYEEVFEGMQKHEFKKDIVFTDYVSDDELRLYYTACDVFVYPSIYEGFGLPPLEAMACGAPVVVSDIPVLREVMGDTPLFVNPNNPEAIADGIHRIICQPALRDRLINRGIEKIREFSWENTAKETLKVYEEALA